MTDDRKRHQSQTDRDLAGLAARRDRQRSGVPVAVPDFEDLTGKYDGEDLARARAKRPTDARIARVEKKQDEDRADHKALASIVTDIQIDVAGMRGELKVLPELVALIKGQHADEHTTRRLGMTTRSKIILAIVGALGTGGLGALITALSGCA